jgi:hypothetical protein
VLWIPNELIKNNYKTQSSPTVNFANPSYKYLSKRDFFSLEDTKSATKPTQITKAQPF